MNAKDRYKNAVNTLEEMLADFKPGIGTPTPDQVLEDIHRYAGELRRKVAILESQKEQDQQQIASSKELLERLQNLPNKVETLEQAKSELEKSRKSLAATNEQLQRRLSELELVAASQARFTDVEDHTQVKVKCLDCSLHFTVYTFSPDKHSCRTLHCPECGQHDGQFLVWREKGRGFIFQNVPGEAQLVEVCTTSSGKKPVLDILHKPSIN